MDKNKIQLGKGLKLNLTAVVESFLFEAGPIAGSNKEGSVQPVGSGSGVNRNVTTGGEDHLAQAYNKIKFQFYTISKLKKTQN